VAMLRDVPDGRDLLRAVHRREKRPRRPAPTVAAGAWELAPEARLRRRTKPASGDNRLDGFSSPRAFALVMTRYWRRSINRAAFSGLLSSWVGRADEVGGAARRSRAGGSAFFRSRDGARFVSHDGAARIAGR